MERSKLIKAIKSRYNPQHIRPSEDFSKDYQGGIWMAAEGDNAMTSNGLPLFEYDSSWFDPEENLYVMGVEKNFYEWLEMHGWYVEFYDPGTALIFES